MSKLLYTAPLLAHLRSNQDAKSSVWSAFVTTKYGRDMNQVCRTDNQGEDSQLLLQDAGSPTRTLSPRDSLIALQAQNTIQHIQHTENTKGEGASITAPYPHTNMQTWNITLETSTAVDFDLTKTAKNKIQGSQVRLSQGRGEGKINV